MALSPATYILQAVATGDFNADGRDDFAVAVDDIGVFPVRAAVLVYLNNGNGFAAPVASSLSGLFPQCIEAADVTGDGALDLVVCHSRSSGGGAEGLITVLGGQRTGDTPNGRFQQIFSGVVGTAPAGAASGDIDGDGRSDLLIVDPAEQRVLILYGSAGPTRFESPAELAEANGPVAALVNDVAGQPLPQVLVAVSSGGRLLTYRQTAPRAFAVPTEQRIALLPVAMALAHVDDDGLDDLLVLSALGAELWYGQTDGTFRFGESLVRDNALDTLTVADLNGDGRLDVAAGASSQDRVTVVLNGADVPFTPAPTPTITETPTRTGTPTRTATPTTGGAVCPGDCDRSHSVAINELIQGVNIALGNAAVGTCPAFDLDGDGMVAINELIAAVNSAQSSCAGPAT